MIVGIADFRGGETLCERVYNEDPRKLRYLAGWNPKTGAALPDLLPTRVSTSALGGAIPAQVPIAFRSGSSVRIVCRDANEKVRVMAANGVWGAAGDAIQVIGDSAPFRLGPLVVFAEDGANARLTSFELDSPTTKTRPLSLKSPRDYLDTAKLTVTPSANVGVQLWNTNNWDSPGTGCFHTNETDYAVLQVTSTTPASHKCFTLDLGGTVSLSGKKYLVLDLRLTYAASDPVERIVKTGEFVNASQASAASGFELVLYSDAACTTEITRYAILQITSDGRVNRVVLHLGTPPSTNVLGIGIDTASYFVAPVAGGDYTLIVHSADFQSNWNFNSNLLFPSVLFEDSPWFDDTFSDPHTLPSDPGAKVSGKTAPTAASILETHPTSFDDYTPSLPRVLWSYCFRGRDALSTELYHVMVSNPSNEDTSEKTATVADPWRTYTLSATLPAVLTDYGDYVTHCLIYRSMYTGLDQDEESGDFGVWSYPEYVGLADLNEWFMCVFLPATDKIWCNGVQNTGAQNDDPVVFGTTAGGVTAGTTYYIINLSGYEFQIATTPGGAAVDLTAAVYNTLQLVNGVRTVFYRDSKRRNVACTMDAATDVAITSDHRLNVGDVVTFGSTTGGVAVGTAYYVVHTFNDRFKFSAEPGGSVFNVTADGANTWTKEDPVLEIDNHDVPQYQETHHDYASSAKYGVAADTRVYAAHLTYDNSTSTWLRKMQLQVSGFEDFSSFSTVVVDDYIDTCGEELGEFAPHSDEIRGLLVRGDVKFIFTDNGFWELIGSSAETGWQFLRRDAIGCISAKTIADCRSQIIWCDGGEFYSYAGEFAIPISKGLIDVSLIDFAAAHGFVFSKDRYVGFCKYNDPAQETQWCLLVYDLELQSWRRRHAESYELAGICVADASGNVYGLTHDGDIVNLFGGTADYGEDEPVYVIDTQPIKVAGPGTERHTSHVVLEAITDQDSLSLELDVYSQGRLNGSDLGRTLTINKNKVKYGYGDFNVDLTGDAVRVMLTYRGATPPDIHFLGVALDDTPVEG